MMAGFTELLAAGDLRSDGFANEAARIVIDHPETLAELMDALEAADAIVRGHAADALEKVARTRPAALAPWFPRLAAQAQADEVPMVRWHLAMVLGHMTTVMELIPAARQVLLRLLHDESPFVRSWAITGLAIIAMRRPHAGGAIARAIAPLTLDGSAAVAKRAQTAIRALTTPDGRLPRTWVKGERPTGSGR
jgi:HEAT repeat protein